MQIARFIVCTRVALLLVAVLVSPSRNASQILKDKGGRIEYADSSVVVGQDTIEIICGVNLDLGLRFWSRALRDQIEYSKERNPVPLDNLYEFSGHDAYLAATPDTSQWRSFSSTKLGISFRYPIGLKARIIHDASGPVIELGEETRKKPRRREPASFVALVRMTFTSIPFSEQARLHGWQFKNDLYYLADKDIEKEFSIADMAYIEGNRWKCVRGLESFRFYDENNSMGIGDSLKFLAMVERSPLPSLLVEFYDAIDHNVFLFEEDVYMVLSSVQHTQ